MIEIIKNGIFFNIGNGERICFWKDKWVGDIELKDKF